MISSTRLHVPNLIRRGYSLRLTGVVLTRLRWDVVEFRRLHTSGDILRTCACKARSATEAFLRPPPCYPIPIPKIAVRTSGTAETYRCATQGTHQTEEFGQQAPPAAQSQRPDSARIEAKRRGAQAHGGDQEGKDDHVPVCGCSRRSSSGEAIRVGIDTDGERSVLPNVLPAFLGR